jgi:hypothetical protein
MQLDQKIPPRLSTEKVELNPISPNYTDIGDWSLID